MCVFFGLKIVNVKDYFTLFFRVFFLLFSFLLSIEIKKIYRYKFNMPGIELI